MQGFNLRRLNNADVLRQSSMSFLYACIVKVESNIHVAVD